jgi:hypothetical protein
MNHNLDGKCQSCLFYRLCNVADLLHCNGDWYYMKEGGCNDGTSNNQSSSDSIRND